ncbi:MAG: replicative DNA helicase, partial [Butyrivibrio sp.]|nr:replicative DNA helicase [Butyrivibrio sp.]
RRLIRASEETADLCFQGEKPLSEILEDTEQRIFRVTQTGASRELVPIRQIVLQSLEHIEKASKTSGNVTGLATGLTDLDYNTAGLQKSDLILLAARPSMGKSALALTMAYNMAVRDDKHVAFFSLEMSAEQLVNRLLAMEGPLDSQHLRSGNLSEDEWERLVQGAGVIGSSHLIIDDTPGITVGELRSRCRKYKLEHDLDLVIIDYLQLMAGSGTRSSDNRQQEVSDISRALKALARELNIPVLALSQLSRAVESRTDHRPMLSDLRESGAIEQDADIVMFIYRDEYYNKDTDKKGITELIIAKQRNGPIGTVNLAFLPEQTRFVSAESEYHKR